MILDAIAYVYARWTAWRMKIPFDRFCELVIQVTEEERAHG